ncbi:hypothetical protein ES703_28201 [subsurface metagenome]
MKKLFFLIPILLILACSEHQIYFSGSVGIYPDRTIFWAFLEYPPPNFGFVEDARVLLDSITRIPFDGEKGGYYREGIFTFTYNSTHTVQVEVEDYEDIYAEATIPSTFDFDMVDRVKAEDSLIIRWTHADSLETPPDRWRLVVIMGGDTLRYIVILPTANEYEIIEGIINDDLEIVIDAIRFGNISGVRSGSVFAGVVRKEKNVGLED